MLRDELSAMHNDLAEASERVEALREAEWGWLGVVWFRFTLRRALRDTSAQGPRHHRTIVGLRHAIARHERALWNGQDVARWLDEALASEQEKEPAREREGVVESAPVRDEPAASSRLRGWLAVLGANARLVGSLLGPVLVVIFAMGMIVMFIAAAASGGVGDLDLDDDGLASRRKRPEGAMSSADRFTADVRIGRGIVAFVLALSVIGAGAGVWSWLQ
ncbi:MAG: hypothetical protein KC619_20065 [Myxococcales bacterium]|nr:hypothetical protein [Myxococcales bacterium]